MWFSTNDFTFNKTLKKEKIYGYVLPHAGTKYTNEIYIHTLQYIPQNTDFDNVYIFYYPANETENVTENNTSYFHEYYVPMKTLKHIFQNWWKINNKKFIGINVRDNTINMRKFNINNSLIIISADFSHFLSMQQAIQIENKAALSLMFKTQHKTQQHVDHMKQFDYVFKRLSENCILKWIGRTRSPGEKGVGYLSFLITKQYEVKKKPNGYFITVYDEDLNARECLGKWEYENKKSVNNYLQDVIQLARTTSRLTNGQNTDIPIKYYKITYLYLDSSPFSRGYHGVKHNAFYLPEVFLENTYENGKWIKNSDTQWNHSSHIFDMSETLSKLNVKAGINTNIQPQLYKSHVYYGSTNN